MTKNKKQMKKQNKNEWIKNRMKTMPEQKHKNDVAKKRCRTKQNGTKGYFFGPDNRAAIFSFLPSNIPIYI